MYEGDEINSFDSNGTFDRPGAIMSSSPNEQQNAAPAKPQKSSWKGNEPDPMFFEEPMPESRQRRTRRKRPWFIGIGILILIVAAAITVVAIINSTKSVTAGDPAIAGQAYLVGLFDKNAPIPFRSTTVAQYGYISPSSFEWVRYSNLNLGEKVLNSRKNDSYTIEWKWVDSDNDTQVGRTKNAKYKLDISIKALETDEFDRNASASAIFNPDTGDKILYFIELAILSAIALILLIILKRRQKD